MILPLQAAAEAARRNTQPNGPRVVEILVTEDGFVVRGQDRNGYGPVTKSRDVTWTEFHGQPHLLLNAVRLVVRELL